MTSEVTEFCARLSFEPLREPIDRMIVEFRAVIQQEGENRGDIVFDDEEQGRDEKTLPTLTDWSKLREAVFDPVVEHLGDSDRLLLSPDGDLTRLPTM